MDLLPVHTVRKAHAAGITCIEPCRNFEEENWLVATGSYDRHIKLWSSDGRLVHMISGNVNTISSLSYIRATRQLWAASSAPVLTIIDPKTGEDISAWTTTWQALSQDYKRSKRNYRVNFLFYSKELDVLIAQTDHDYLLHWYYNSSGSVLSIPCPNAIESFAFTKTEPILLFTGDSDGNVLKWEKSSFDTVKFSYENLKMHRKIREIPVEWQRTDDGKEDFEANTSFRREVTPSTFQVPRFYHGRRTDEHEENITVAGKTANPRTMWIEELDVLVVADERGVLYVWGYDSTNIQPEEFARRYAESAGDDNAILDNIVAVPQNYIRNAKSALRSPVSTTAPKIEKGKSVPLSGRTADPIKRSADNCGNLFGGSTKESAIVNDSSCIDFKVRTAMNDWKTYKHFLNRASGFFCRFVLWGHDGCVSGLDYVYYASQNMHILISTGWDRRIITWNIQTGEILDTCKRDKTEPKILEERETPGEYELVAEGQITDISYSAQRDEVAYSSRDAHLYVRKFAIQGRKMKLMKKWHAHNGEVLQVKWMAKNGTWASSGRDGSVRVWSGNDLGVRLALVYRPVAVQGLTVDPDCGWILASVSCKL